MGFDRRGDLKVGHARCALKSVTSMPCNDCFPDEVELARMSFSRIRERIVDEITPNPTVNSLEIWEALYLVGQVPVYYLDIQGLCAQFPQAPWWCKRSQPPGAETPRMQLSRCPAGPAYPSVEANLEVWQVHQPRHMTLESPWSCCSSPANLDLTVVLPDTWPLIFPGADCYFKDHSCLLG